MHLSWRSYVNHVFLAFCSGQIIQRRVMHSLIPPAIQRGTCMRLVPSPIKPPQMAPAKVKKKAHILLFLLIFFVGPARSFGSDQMSCNILVTTTVGTSTKPTALDPTICPDAWNESKAIGMTSHQLMSSEIVSIAPSTDPPCTTAAAIKMIRVCHKKEPTITSRRRLPRRRVVCEKTRQPRQKQKMETRDLAQP